MGLTELIWKALSIVSSDACHHSAQPCVYLMSPMPLSLKLDIKHPCSLRGLGLDSKHARSLERHF